MNDALVWRLLVNAAWQIPLCGLVAMFLDRMLRLWPAAWRVILWRGALLAAATLPVATALWNPAPEVTGGFVLPAAQASADAVSGWTFPIGSIYAAAMAFFALRLAWRWWQTCELNVETATVPVTYGVRNAVVILPARFAREATDLARQAALAHESVHVEQRDYFQLLIAELITLPVAMHPATAWIKRRLSDSVELRCDEFAAAKFRDPHEYAQGLIDAARVLAGRGSSALAPGFWNTDTFEERMTNLMESKKRPGKLAKVLAAGAMLTVGFTMVICSTRFATAAAQDDGRVYKVGRKGVSAPAVLHKVEPQYSQSAKDAKVEGAVTLTLEVTPEGRAEKFQVLKSLEPTLDQAAIDAVKQWKFRPAQKAGKPVRVSATIEVNFRLL